VSSHFGVVDIEKSEDTVFAGPFVRPCKTVSSHFGVVLDTALYSDVSDKYNKNNEISE
jgi:hypothetical protein